MKKIGITGNIASGKSEVEKIISTLGYKVYDLDKITHNLYEDDFIKQEIEKEFSTTNRKQNAKIVLEDKTKLNKLEDILFPHLRNFILNVNDEIAFISGALIFEANFNKHFDKIIFINAPCAIRLNRLIKRNNLTKQEAIKRMELQNLDSMNKADYIIENDTNIEDLRIKVTELITKITK